MNITLLETRGALKKLRRTAGMQNQITLHVSPQESGRLAGLIVEAIPRIESASIVIDEAVFEPRNLNALLAKNSIPTRQWNDTGYLRDWTIRSHGRSIVAEVLGAVLRDRIEFFFIPEPKNFIIFADHDEYFTVYAARKGLLNKVAGTLQESGFQAVDHFKR